MNDLNTIEVIGTIVVTLLTYLASQKWVFPAISKCWNWFKEREQKQIDVTEELHTIKMNEQEYYEKTFQTLLNQITSLEEELQSYASELEKLRTTILRLNSKLYDKSLLISQLQSKCCERMDCPHRIVCKNYCNEIIENGESNNN